MEKGHEGGDAAQSQQSRSPGSYSPSSPSSNGGEEPMDWSSNLPGIRQLLNTPGGQLKEGPTSACQKKSAESASNTDTTAGTAVLMPPPPVPPPAAAATGTNVTTRNEPKQAVAPDTTPRAVPVPTTTTATANATTTTAENAAERAKDIIRAAAEKKVKSIIESLGEDALAYNVIKKVNEKKHRLKDLKTGQMLTITNGSTLLSALDGRMRQAEVSVILGQHETWTYSFSLRSLECIGCSQHINYSPFPRRGSQVRGGRQAIWLTDQSMPPILPVSPAQQCVKIIRLESGMLQELAEGLVRTLSGRQIAAGSIVLLTSVTNMLAAGTAGYADDLFRAIRFLRRSLGDHLVYGPLPNIFINGCDDSITIRTAFEFTRWARMTLQENTLLSASFEKVENMLTERCDGDIQEDSRITLRLPTAEGNNLISYTSGGWDNVPAKLRGCSVGWVDIGTRARVSLRLVVYLKKSRENDTKLVFSSNHFSDGPGHTVQYTI
jgi:hypothetical protein